MNTKTAAYAHPPQTTGGLTASKINSKIVLTFLFTLIFSWGLSDTEVLQITLQSIADAYIGVSIFVSATLLLFYSLEYIFKIDTVDLLNRYKKWEVCISSFLGALPGCGGAIIVITQYVRGHTTFGSVVAVLIATMGDAAFLLLSKQPLTALFVFATAMVVGSISGYFINWLHGDDFLRRPLSDEEIAPIKDTSPFQNVTYFIWTLLMVPGFFLGILEAFTIDTNALFANSLTQNPTYWIGVFGGILSIIMWLMATSHELHAEQGLRSKVISDTNFVTVWVILAFLVFELAVYQFHIDLTSVFDIWSPLVPLLAVAVGLLPGCGPQIIVTTLYLNGFVPLSAQMANTISNDGDALFPAISLAPKAAIIATLYSAVPAVIVGYLMWFFE